jgi:hypothetical protein
MRRGLVLVIFAVAALAGLPAAASAAEGDPLVYLSPADGWVFPQGATFSFGFACESPNSAIVSCVGSQPLGSALDTFHAGPHTLWVTATDWEGRQTTATSTYTVFDFTKPYVVFRTPSDAAVFELGSSATIDYSCEDDAGGLGILDGGCIGTYPSGAPLDTRSLGTFAFSVTAVDKQFNVAQETIHYTVVDRTPPVVALVTPADGAVYSLGQPVYAWFYCDDGGSGLNGCKGDVPPNTQIDTATLGTKTFTVNAFDRAGNMSSATHLYSVVYDFAGFLSPSATYPAAASMKAGESVPLKFSLHSNQGSDIFAPGSPGWVPCGASDGPSAADGSLSYNASADRYTYLAATPKSWAGSCRDLVLTLRDGTTHRARFTFTK